MVILVTGGSGFIGTNLVTELISKTTHSVINLDALTYAGKLNPDPRIAEHKRNLFIHGDICDKKLLEETFKNYNPNIVIHMAAESHVDRSITNSKDFISTNIVGTANLLNVALDYFRALPKYKQRSFRFLHVSTDEVFGDLGVSNLYFEEHSPYKPSSPYSASKASSDMLVRAWHRTYGLPTIITNCSNNYGPHQHSEKMIPKIINSALNNLPIPIYGDGTNQRDWLYVDDHLSALIKIMTNGEIGETYLIGGNVIKTNIELVEDICTRLDLLIPEYHSSKINKFAQLIKFVDDRLGHDKRYAINSTKLLKELNWQPKYSFSDGINRTIEWYVERFSITKKT